MSPAFLPNRQLNKILAILILGFSLTRAYAQDQQEIESSQSLGLLQSLEELISLQKNEFKKDSTSTTVKEFQYLDKNRVIEDISLAPFFLKHILFNGQDKYHPLVNSSNECTFYSALLNDLIKSGHFSHRFYYADIKFSDRTQEIFKIEKSDFFNTLFKIKCGQLKEVNNLFKDNSLLKTLKSINFSLPSTEKQCQETLQEWLVNPYTAYICRVNDHIDQGLKASKIIKRNPNISGSKRKILNDKTRKMSTLQNSLSYFQLSYIKNMCGNLNSSKKFCSPYIRKDIWGKVINGEREAFLMKYKCKNMFQRKNIGIKEFRLCAEKFNKEAEACTEKGNKGFPSFYPLQNCQSISDSLNNSRLKTDYHDCPASIDNESITNIHRIYNHFKDRKIISSPDQCAGETVYSFAQLNFEANGKDKWPMQICYFDKIQSQEKCFPYVPGDISDPEISETHVITRIIKRIIDVPESTKCQISSKENFKPERLKYKVGCHIVYDQNQCTTIKCNKKIYFNLKEITDIKYVGIPLFDYFPNSFLHHSRSLSNSLNDHLKLKNQNIRNITELKNFFINNKSGIIHGMGCIENILPFYFKRKSLNDCRPTPFILDGFIEKKGKPFIITRLATDDIHTPRAIHWNKIFSAVLSFKELHPLKTWTLYGIKK